MSSEKLEILSNNNHCIAGAGSCFVINGFMMAPCGEMMDPAGRTDENSTFGQCGTEISS